MIAHGGGPPGAVEVFGSWQFDPLVVGGIVLIGVVYLEAARRMLSRPGPNAFPLRRIVFFLSGLLVLFLALQSPIDTYADLLLSDHMAQHLLLTMVVPPLLLLGAPVTLALGASSPGTRRRYLLPVLRSRAVKVLGSPLVGWTLFAAVMWGTHFPPFYDAALRSEAIHSLEHLAYLVSALLFWWPIIGLDPNPARLSPPARILYVFVSMPVTAFLGLAIYSSDRILYRPYAVPSRTIGVSPLGDQHLAGGVMWEGGMLVIVVALAFVLLDWMRRDERSALRSDARRARAAARG